MSETLEERLRHNAHLDEFDVCLTRVYAGDVVELLDARDKIIAEQRAVIAELNAAHDAQNAVLARMQAELDAMRAENAALSSLLDEWLSDGRFMSGNSQEKDDLVNRSGVALGRR